MKKKCTILILLTVFGLNAHAINVQSYKFSNSLTYQGLESAWNDDPISKERYPYLLTLSYSYFDQPLVLEDPDRTSQIDELVSASNVLHLGFGSRFWGGFLSLNTSLVLQSGLKESTVDSPKDDFGISDLDINWKKQVYTNKSNNFAIALMPILAVPIGNTDFYLSDEGVGLGLLSVFEKRWDRLHITGNLGYRYTDQDVFFDIDRSQIVETSLGVFLPFGKDFSWGASFEYRRYWTFSKDEDYNPTEAHISIQKRFSKKLTAFASFGSGDFTKLSDNVNGNSFRALAGIKFIPDFNRGKQNDEPIQVVKNNIEDNKGIEDDRRVVEEKPATVVRKCFYQELGQVFLYFDFDSSEFRQTQKNRLERFVSQTKSDPSALLKAVIKGRTDSRGDDKYNLKLSENRAKSVRAWLENIENIDKVEVVPLGETSPIVKDARTVEEHRRNRVVEVVLFELGEPNLCL